MTRMAHSQPIGRRYLVALGVLLLLSFFINLGGVPLFDEDEGAYSEVTREMVASGDYVTPRLNGATFFHKPPMIYWAQALSTAVFGFSEFSLRLPSAVAATFWVIALFQFVRRYAGIEAAWYAALFLISGLQTGLIAKAAIADALLNLFVTLTCFHIYHYYRNPKRRHILLTFVFMALGTLTKGPIAIAIPFVTSGVFFFWQRRWARWFRAISHPGGWLVFLALALPWYIMLYRIHGEAFINEIFFTHNVDRFNVAFEGHGGGFFYYLPVIVLGMMPHTAFLFQAAASGRRLLASDLDRFCLIWFLFVFLFFSLAGTKLHHYIVYGYPPLLLFMGQAAHRVTSRLAIGIWPLVFGGVLFLLPFFFGVVQPLITDEFARLVVTGAAENIGLGYRLVTGGAVLAFSAGILVKRFSRQHQVLLNALVFVLLVNGYVIPLVGSVMQSPIREAARMARDKQLEVVMWQMTAPSFSVYRDRITANRNPEPGDVVITKINKLDTVSKHAVLYEKNGIVMTRILAFKPK